MAKANKYGKSVCFKLTYDAIEKLDKVSDYLGQSKTKAMERAIDQYYKEHMKEEEACLND